MILPYNLQEGDLVYVNGRIKKKYWGSLIAKKLLPVASPDTPYLQTGEIPVVFKTSMGATWFVVPEDIDYVIRKGV